LTLNKKKDICPAIGERVLFAASTAFARKIDVQDKLVTLTGGHRGRLAKIDSGWIIIDQAWFAK
jgi:hypothetical protein